MIEDGRFTAECREMLPSLYRIGMSILRHDADAQDAVQQALLKAWAARERVDEMRFKQWLTRITVNECRNIQRQRMRVVPVEEIEERAQDAPDEALREALGRLPTDKRLTLTLKYMEGYTEREIARILAISVPAVKGRLNRARKALARELKEEVTWL